jgi:hypothetical protein
VSGRVLQQVQELLTQSLAAWRVEGDVKPDTDGTLVLRAAAKQLRIARAPASDQPFRWVVTEGERARPVTSIAGLLRNVRLGVDPGYQPVRLRVAPLPVLPP